MVKLIDANVILRYLLNDIEIQAQEAYEVIKNGAFTTVEVICEVLYVLKSLYLVPKVEIKEALSNLLDEIYVDHYEVIINALKIFSLNNLDFVDCILISRNEIYNDEIFTFDKKLKTKLKSIEETL